MLATRARVPYRQPCFLLLVGVRVTRTGGAVVGQEGVRLVVFLVGFEALGVGELPLGVVY